MGIFDIFTNNNAQNAANAQIAGITKGQDTATQYINQGNDALTTNYTAALQPFVKNYDFGSQGVNQLATLLGLSGDPTKITAQLAATPGYQFQLNQGNENILRNAARTGSTNSGGTNIDLTNYGQGLAGTTYNNLVSQLQPFLGYSTAGASGIGNIYTGLGTALNSNYGSLANLGWQANTGVGNATANADLANNNASANFWNLLQNFTKLGTSGAGAAGGGAAGSGGPGGLGGIFSGLGSGIGSAASGIGGGIGDIIGSLAMFSDERLKEDIEPVGTLYDGTNVYRYRYIDDPVPRIGLIAQEVEAVNPDAVTEIAGFKAVDYGKATDYASKLAQFLEAA